MVEGFLRLMGTEDQLTGPVNLGNPGEFSIRQLAEKILSITGSRSKIVHQPLPADDPRQRQPDIGLATQVLGWVPKVSLDDGLEKTIAYFDQMLSGTVEEADGRIGLMSGEVRAGIASGVCGPGA
jgi:UDP-glucuronate decarboxylase